MKKPLIALLLSATIAWTGAAPTAVQAGDDEDLLRILLGIATVAIIADAVNDRRNQSQPANNGQNWNHHVIPSRQRVLPAECVVEVDVRRGRDITMLGRRCMERNYRWANRLPEQCELTVETRRHDRSGYSIPCLRRAGYEIGQRRVRQY
ncbi:hypothetical protein EU803_08325 [Loktanella sp. IMCC34160]|uniref:hypothetical protein n=1 Tax=Loktanella sp. IMCC34160 TaxID=2510646 RepID=UPI00101E0732|nr:hypothetical protein [Loktanella sp. IMCC34160]RYG91096.1 hypothetical protein EU803_08325 [Loktanella sp. IMCC34160]